MTKKMQYLLGILATILIGTWLFMKFCCPCAEGCEQDGKANVAANADVALQSKFQLSGTDLNYQCSDNFKFMNGGFNKLEPISDSINFGIDALKGFFDKGKENLKITGYALASEKNTSIYENLGIARATDIKKYFISKGIAENRIEVFGEIKDDLTIAKDTLIGPASYSFYTPEVKTETTKVDYDALKKKINANPLIMYFKTGETSINLSDDDRKKVADMLIYLDNVPTAKLDVVGHTDNVGKREVNTKLGLGRAEFAAEYLLKNGIATDKIATSSKGPDEPIADNNTKEGKDKNRRTVVSLK
jgi:OmpA-OmpF porin, OOP family